MRDMEQPTCHARRCRHFRGVTELTDLAGRSKGEPNQVVWCNAFPSGIPDRIAYGDDPHVAVAADQFGTDIYEESGR